MVNVKPVKLGNTERMSFGKIDEVIDMPNLIDIQKASYKWLLDEGLKEVFKDVSGITDYQDNLVLDFIDYTLDVDHPNYSVIECKVRDATYSAALRVTARLLNKSTGEIKESNVFMGDFPLMTDAGTFVINGAERAIVSQLVRSPGVFYGDAKDKVGNDLYSATMNPNRGAWLEYETDASNVFYVRIDKTRIGTMDDYFQAKAGNAIGTPIAHLQPTRMPAVDLVNRPAITLLDLISRGSTKGDFEYLQILSVTRNTGIIPENTGDEATDTQKPQSTFSTALADAKVYGYADGYTVTNQLLEDDSAMASFLQNEFDYSFQLKLADMLLNGTGTNGQPKGLLNTTGVQAGNWTKADDEARNLVVAIRQSLTKLRAVGATASAILVNPEDAEKIDLMTDVNKRFMGNGPFGTGPTTVWGRPLVECDQIEAGKAIVGDFRQMALLDRSGLTVEAFNQHKDYASRNLTYVRAELRAAQVIWRPANFVVLEAK